MSTAGPLPESRDGRPRRNQAPYQHLVNDAGLRTRNANPGTAQRPHHPEPELIANDRHDPAGRSAGLIPDDAAADAAIHAIAVSAADREARTTAEPPDLAPSGSEWPDPEWPDPEWPDPAWPGFAPGRRHPSYAFTLAASPWYKERYPDKAANLWDALHAGRAPQPAPEPDRLADWEAGE